MQISVSWLLRKVCYMIFQDIVAYLGNFGQIPRVWLCQICFMPFQGRLRLAEKLLVSLTYKVSKLLFDTTPNYRFCKYKKVYNFHRTPGNLSNLFYQDESVSSFSN